MSKWSGNRMSRDYSDFICGDVEFYRINSDVPPWEWRLTYLGGQVEIVSHGRRKTAASAKRACDAAAKKLMKGKK